MCWESDSVCCLCGSVHHFTQDKSTAHKMADRMQAHLSMSCACVCVCAHPCVVILHLHLHLHVSSCPCLVCELYLCVMLWVQTVCFQTDVSLPQTSLKQTGCVFFILYTLFFTNTFPLTQFFFSVPTSPAGQIRFLSVQPSIT